MTRAVTVMKVMMNKKVIDLGKSSQRAVGIVRRSPRKNKIRSQDESNNENLDAISQSCNENLKENRDKINNDNCGAQEQMIKIWRHCLETHRSIELNSKDICRSSKSQKRKASFGHRIASCKT